MPMEIEGLSFAKHGAGLVAQSQAAFQAAVERGRVFSVANQAGITTAVGLSATTPALTLYNRAGSGINLVVWYVSAAFTVAFATAGAIWVAVGSDTVAAAVTGTVTTAHRNMRLGGPGPGSVPLLAATLPAAPVAIAVLGVGLTGAITTVPVAAAVERW